MADGNDSSDGAAHAPQPSVLSASLPPLRYPPLFDMRSHSQSTVASAAVNGGVDDPSAAAGGASSSASEGSFALPAPLPEPVDVNVTYVVEKPRQPRVSVLRGLFTRRSGASPGSPRPSHTPQLSVLQDVSHRDFNAFIAGYETARKRAEIRKEAIAGVEAVMCTPVRASRGGSAGATASSPSRSEEVLSSPTSTGVDAFTIVPAQFFSPSFDIGNKHTFNAILASGPLLETQEKLTDYLNAVETQLINLIRARSHLFFEALHSLTELRDSVATAAARVQQLQQRVGRVREEAVVAPLSIIAGSRRRARHAAVLSILHAMREVQMAQGTIGQLIATGDLMGALEVVASARALLRTKLARIIAAGGYHRSLDEYERMIGDTLVSNVVSTTSAIVIAGLLPEDAADLSQTPVIPSASLDAFLSGEVSSTSMLRHDPAEAGDRAASQSLEAALQAQLRPLLDGAARIGRFGDALTAVQATVVREMKLMVRSEVADALRSAEAADAAVITSVSAAAGADTNSMDGLGGGPHTSAAAEVPPERITSLSPDAFLLVLRSLTRCLLDLLQRVHAFLDLTEKVLDTHNTRPGVGAPVAAAGHATGSDWRVEISRLRAVATGILAAALDAAQKHAARLLSIRRPQADRLKVRELRVLWDACTTYAGGASTLQARAGLLSADAAAAAGASPLLDECMEHARAMLAYQQNRNVTTISAMLDAEQWRAADVPAQVQAVAEAIVACATVTPGATVVQSAAAAMDGIVPVHSSEDEAAALAAGVSRVLTIKGHPFRLVCTGIMLVKMLGDYTSLAEAVPGIAADIINATAELLRAFNTRSTQLVLGAGAMQTAAGLKRITAKHLALTAQTVGAVLALLPSVHAALGLRLPPQQQVLLQELTHVNNDLMTHEHRIMVKFEAMVKDLLADSCSKMTPLPWGDAASPMSIPSAPMRELVKGIILLHKILAGVLRGDQLLDILSHVAVMAAAQLPLRYAELLRALTDASLTSLMTAPAPTSGSSSKPAFSREVANQRMHADVHVLITCFSDLLAAHPSASNGVAPDSAGATAARSSHEEAQDALTALRSWAQRQFSQPAPAAPSSGAVTVESVVTANP